MALLIAATLSALVAVLATAPAQAKLRYSKPQTVSPQGEQHQVAVDPLGRATVVWEFTPPGGTGNSIQSRRIGPGGAAGPVRTLSTGNLNANPDVGVDPQGRATVVWESGHDPEGIRMVRLAADGTPGLVRNLGTEDHPGPGAHHDPQVAVDPQGRATVVLEFGFDVIEAVHVDAAGDPGPVRVLSEEGSSENPIGLDQSRVAVDPQGHASVVWQHDRDPDDPSGPRTIRMRRLGAGGEPLGPTRVVAAGISPDAAVDPQGRTTVVWRRGNDPGVQTMRISANGAPEELHTVSRTGLEPSVAVDPRGRATVVWQEFGINRSPLESQRLGADGSPLGRARTVDRDGLAGPDGFDEASVGVDRHGRSIVVWRESGSVQARSLRPNGAPAGMIEVLGSRGSPSFPMLALDSLGQPTVAWVREKGNRNVIQTARGRLVPVTKITTGPNRKTAKRRAKFKFRSDEPGSTFECKLDKRKWKPCESPYRVKKKKHLKPGRHRLKVRATAAGNRSKADAHRWRIR